MAKVSYGKSKAARRADSGSYLTVLPTPEMPYETESADQAYLRQAPRSRVGISPPGFFIVNFYANFYVSFYSN